MSIFMGNFTLKVPKKAIYAFLALVVIAVIVLAYVFMFLPKQVEKKEIQEYKKVLFEGTLCQYSCPLSNQMYQNRTQLLPEKECTEKCLDEFKKKTLAIKIFTTEELQKDDTLIADVELAITTCRQTNLDAQGQVVNEKFFDCSVDGLNILKEKYDYLN